MIRSLQTVGWGFLPPTPVSIEPGVVCLLGQNGSGKTSSLNAIAALLGARRFGDRSASSYRFAGRCGHPAAKHAWLVGVFSNLDVDGHRRLDGYGDEFTVALEVGARQRRFLVRDGAHLLPTGEALAAAITNLREQHPRSAWWTPEEYARRVLDPLGIGPAVRRLHELPQGEVQRALDRDPRTLVGVILELTGGRDASERFEAAELELRAARDAQSETQRRLDRRRADLAEARLSVVDDERALLARAELAQLAAAAQTLVDSVVPVEEPFRQARVSVLARGRLRDAGVELVDCGGVWAVSPDDVEKVVALLAPGEALPVADDGLAFLVGRGSLVTGPPVGSKEHALDDQGEELRTHAAALRGHLARLAAAGIEPEAATFEEEEWSPQGLLGALAALTRGGVPAQPDPSAAARLDELATALAADQDELNRRRGALADAERALVDAQVAYVSAVSRSLDGVAARFGELCLDAGLVGRLEVGLEAGRPSVEIWAAEEEGSELRPLHGAQASLSGGWRTTVVVLCVLAALQAESATPVLLLDEVGASLDEERLVALGHAFARLAERRGLQTVLSLPSRTQVEAVAEFSRLQIGYLRPFADEPLAPPPHIVCAGARTLAA